MVKATKYGLPECSPPTAAAGHLNKNPVTTDREGVIEKRSIGNDFHSWQQCGPLVSVYLCGTAGPQKMHEGIKDFYGETWLENCLCV